MPQPITIRAFTVADKDEVQQLLIESYSQYEAVFRSPEAWSEYVMTMRASVDNPNVERILVATKGPNIVGTVQLFESGDKAYQRPGLVINHPVIRLLAVHPNARGQGVAQRLIKESLKIATAKGADYLYLHSGDIMSQAIKLYEWLGFKRDESKEFLNGESLVKCFRFDLKKECGRFDETGAGKTINRDSQAFAPASRAVKRGV
ncbi:GNAT family N-acetyltransferase [Shouchella clausii]|uniref:GNAT family N-acetyltransferase n=1 Tax=Shouchella clausii TaxID=79880 RepID=UPI000B97A098|nr:GNAT family N-acetyltransferase [Shouchella clausii]AST96111.1 GNAT family N-acetyltransferase [Shouchella clausii]MCR1289485.1 GNAT family N-acetyltransferase [Shouchella clausii]MEB5473700.1 GNAT family N-acetyltransferase [Shouchella clausii]MEB5479266.1 GNAT family N-acetyltransferase [Shouchella clausii]PAD14709.1 GNAT family N-acetyltransferase [Shouchella clausii]